QWARICRSMPLQGTGATSSLPALWLELRPTRAIAAQPRVDASTVTLTLGVEAETRITAVQTKPDCPFPAVIAIVPPTPGGVHIAVPIELAVESEAAFGLLGAAARAAMPHLQKALADQATVDLKPFASNAQKKIAAVISDFQKNEDGVRVAAEITRLRLAEIAFDSKTLRVIAEANGAISVSVTALPGL